MTHARRRHRPRTSALALAAGACVLVLAAVAAVFIPQDGKGVTAPRHVSPWFLIHPLPSHSASSSGSPGSSPIPPTSAQPVAFPAPVRTYPAPARQTFPAPQSFPAPPHYVTPAPPAPVNPCHPRTSGGRCYEPGGFCPARDDNLVGLAGDGKPIVCTGGRWLVGSRPPPPPGADLPPPQTLTPPLAGVVDGDVAAWDELTGHRAQLSVRYVSMAKPLAPTWLHSTIRDAAGAEPVIEITPTAPGDPALSLKAIAAGQADPWLRQLAAQVAALGHPVVVSFAPEDNGTWYAWSREGPAAYQAAYRHVHAVVGTAGVTWLWQVSASNPSDPSAAEVLPYWPGADVVDWVGLDGYFWRAADTFDSRFAHTLGQVTGLGKPVLIAETGVSPADVSTGKPLDMGAAMRSLFAGVRARGLLGMVYFDLPPGPQQGGPFHPDFRLARYPSALTAYRQAITAWP